MQEAELRHWPRVMHPLQELAQQVPSAPASEGRQMLKRRARARLQELQAQRLRAAEAVRVPRARLPKAVWPEPMRRAEAAAVLERMLPAEGAVRLAGPFG